ncbi:MAG TPA: ATP-NAD kinase, partial [Candidatus Methanofastidiosa archaeon]|nr:ATP-NAD kinase [Candidatus Methanofastidiosa archaeon]
RGNHQISPYVLQRVGRENVIVVGTPQKLQNTPYLFVDTGDHDLDMLLAGHMSVVCGYRLAARKSVLTC